MKRILFQFDTDPIPSTFDRVVAVDAGADEIFSMGGITPEDVVPLVHGAIFTRGPKDLQNTAIFIGGSSLQAAEKVFHAVNQAFFGPMRVSVMLDPSGSATTAAAAVRLASIKAPLTGSEALVLGGTGPVGQQVGLLLASQGARVRIASREISRAESVAGIIRSQVEGASVVPVECTDDALAAAVDGIQLLVSAGAAGISFLTTDEWQSIDTLKAAIDLNAVPPLGLQGIEPADQGVDRNGVLTYGSLGVGGYKMRLHRAAVAKLFTVNNLTLDARAIYALGDSVD